MAAVVYAWEVWTCLGHPYNTLIPVLYTNNIISTFMCTASYIVSRIYVIPIQQTQVCVQQTTLDLLSRGFDVHVIADGCSSRSQVDRLFALEVQG